MNNETVLSLAACISRLEMNVAGHACYAERCKEDGIDLSVALPANLLKEVCWSLPLETEGLVYTVTTMIALRVQFEDAVHRCDGARRSLHMYYGKPRGGLSKADLVRYAATKGIVVQAFETKAELLDRLADRLYPRTTWLEFVKEALAC